MDKQDEMPTESDETREYELVGEKVRIFRRGERWYANYQHQGRQYRTSLSTTSKKEARRRAIQLEADLLSGRHAPQSKAPRLEEVISQYRDYLLAEGRRPKTLAKYENAFRLFVDLASRRNVRRIDQVDRQFVDAFRAERQRNGAAPKTIHNDTVTLRQLVNFALSRGLLREDPLRGMKLKKPKTPPQPCWTKEQVEQILAQATEPWRSQLRLLAETGMRVGELKWLTWDDVDLQNAVLHIRPKDDWKPKTGDVRAIPISPPAREVLERLPKSGRWVVTARPSRKYPLGRQQIGERRLLQYLKRVLKRLGLAGHLHTFRHTFISHALTAGTPEAIVREWVGHVDRDVLRQYTHIADAASQAAMQRLASGQDSSDLQQRKEARDDEPREAKSAHFQHNENGG